MLLLELTLGLLAACVTFAVVARRTLIVIGLVLATAALLLLIQHTRQVLTWILIAGFFAVALNPAVTWVQRRAAFGRRWLATLLVFLVAFAAIAGAWVSSRLRR